MNFPLTSIPETKIIIWISSPKRHPPPQWCRFQAPHFLLAIIRLERHCKICLHVFNNFDKNVKLSNINKKVPWSRFAQFGYLRRAGASSFLLLHNFVDFDINKFVQQKSAWYYFEFFVPFSRQTIFPKRMETAHFCSGGGLIYILKSIKRNCTDKFLWLWNFGQVGMRMQ